MPAVEELQAEHPARIALRGRAFRCFAYERRSDGFVAECVDLNIIVQAKTMKKAVASLRDAIEGYLAVVANGDSEDGLIPRRSPLSHRLHYHLVGVKIRVAMLIHKHLDVRALKLKTFECPAHCHSTA